MPRRTPTRLVAGAGLLALTTVLIGTASASSPTTSSATPSSTAGADVTVTWTGTLPGGANSSSDCTLATSDALNDHHTVAISVPTRFYDKHNVSATFTITPSTPAVDDVIESVVLPGGGSQSADNGGFGSAETIGLSNPVAGTYDVVGCTFAGGPQPYTGTLVLHTLGAGDTVAAGGTAPGVKAPTYGNYVAPGALASDAGEPSIGTNWKTGAAFLVAGLQTDKITFDSTGNASWSDVSATQTSLTSLDPIGASDSKNGRFLVSQLSGFDSLSAFTDDDGQSYTSSQGGGIPSGVDHQTVGFGPYPKGGLVGPVTSFPNAAYYCSQELVTAFCARSDTGGLTFGAGVPIYTTECGGLHGHVRVAPDGTVYVPNKACGAHQGVSVSTDAGQTWTVRTNPYSSPGDSDPSVASGSDGTTYFGYSNGDGKAEISVTQDQGKTFSRPVDVGAALGIKNMAFPEVIAGDGDRAAFAFLGTTTPGSSQDPDFGKDASKTSYVGGEYHLYIATTYDRGVHWTTVDATGKDPVQRGKICQGGTVGCGPKDRNLLDFMDIQIDRQGRVLVGWADGCTAGCVGSNLVASNTFSAKGTVTRQSTGLPLFRTPAATGTS